MRDYFIEECDSGDKYIWQREAYGLGSYRWRLTHAMGIGMSHWEPLSFEQKGWFPAGMKQLTAEEVFIELL